MDMVMSPVNIALLNSVFRIATILILAPFISKIEKLVFFLIKDTDEDNEEQADFDLLEERFLDYPPLAISQSQMAVNGMAKNARKNLMRAFELLTDFSDSKFNKIQEKENMIDKYEDKLGTYLMQLSDEERAFKYERFISSKIPCVIFSTMTRPSQDMIDLSDHTVKNNLLKFQISDHAKCHWRSNRNICGGFLKHIVCFISHCNDCVSLGRDHIFLDISFVSEKRIDFYGTASQIYSICFLK